MSTQQEIESLDLKEQFGDLIEEGRMILPGIQALFGFQLISVFSDAFGSKLSHEEQRIHLVAIAFTTIAIALTLTPAAMHRCAEPDQISRRLVRLSSAFLAWSLLPLALGVVTDFYLVSRVILGDVDEAVAAAVPLLLLLASLWALLPLWLRWQRAARARRAKLEPTR